jgi:hypothetical protein
MQQLNPVLLYKTNKLAQPLNPVLLYKTNKLAQPLYLYMFEYQLY